MKKKLYRSEKLHFICVRGAHLCSKIGLVLGGGQNFLLHRPFYI